MESQCKCRKRHVCEKDYIWKPATCSCKNGKHLASITDDSAVTKIYDQWNFKEKKSNL